MIIEYQDSWKSIGWTGKNNLTLYFRNKERDWIKFSLTQEEKDQVTLFRSGYNKGKKEGEKK